MGHNFTTEEVFESAVSIVRNLPKEGSIKPSDELKLKLYAYYKQATHGLNDTPKPRFYQIVEAYKWDAWHKLGNMGKEEAMLNYIRELKHIMESIPGEEADTESSKHFEDILGRKFYDYCKSIVSQQLKFQSIEFTDLNTLSNLELTTSPFLGFEQWKLSGQRDQLVSGNSQEDRESSQSHKMLKSNDTQSISSQGSSMSMLEETQSAGDGYKTPNSLAFKETFTGEVSDQVALAVLRLQHGLDETVLRLNVIENQLKQSLDSIYHLENQTYAKQSAYNIGKEIEPKSNSFVRNLRSMKALHWFYLSYPFLVYFVIRALERRIRSSPR